MLSEQRECTVGLCPRLCPNLEFTFETMEDPLFASARFTIEKSIVLYGELEYQQLTLIPKNKALKTPSSGKWSNDFHDDGWSKMAVVIDYLNMNSAYIPHIKIGTRLSMINNKKSNGSEVELEDNVIIYECTKPVSTADKFYCKKIFAKKKFHSPGISNRPMAMSQWSKNFSQ